MIIGTTTVFQTPRPAMRGHHEGVLDLRDAVIGDGGLDDPAVVALTVYRDDDFDLHHGGKNDLDDGLDGNDHELHGVGVGHDHGDGDVSIRMSSLDRCCPPRGDGRRSPHFPAVN